MKIYVLGTRGIPGLQGGVERHCECLYPEIAKAGCEITVFARISYFPKSERPASWKNVKIKYLPSPRHPFTEAFVHTFFCVVRTLIDRPDIVHVHNMGPALWIPFIKFFGIKVLFTYHSINYLHQKWGKFAKKILRTGEFLGVSFADAVVTVSGTTQKYLEERYPRKRIKHIPNGIEKMSEEKSDILEKYRLKTREYLFTACRFTPEKGILDLINAYLKAETTLKLVIAGDGDFHDAYVDKIKERALCSKNIILTGKIFGSDLATLYRNTGIFVLPSYSEGQPLALLEAISFNLPVIVSDIPQTREFGFKEQRYFPVGDIDILSDKMSDFKNFNLDKEESDIYNKFIVDLEWKNIAKQTYLELQGICK